MFRNKSRLVLISIIILAFLAGNLVYPKYFDLGADFLNSKFHLKIPHFFNLPFHLGLDLEGGSHLVYEANLSQIPPENYSNALESLRDIIERRVNLFGVREPIVQTQKTAGHYRVIVELAGIKDVGEAINMIGQTPYLEFKESLPPEKRAEIINSALGEKAKDASPEQLCFDESFVSQFIIIFGQDPCYQPTLLTGKYLKSAALSFQGTSNEPLVSITFDEEGAKIFEEVTARNVNKALPAYIDQLPISIPRVNEKISGGKAQITGKFTIEQARKLASNLNAGALPVPIELISQQTVGPTLGEISLQRSLEAGAVGFLAVIIFMVFFYRLPGLLASLALGVYLVLVLSIFKLMPVTLTLAGIGGFILSIGMAVDANILIFARMREEIHSGKDLISGEEEGVRRAWPSIRDSNLTTIIVCLILFFFGTSFVQGFSLTLMIGVLVSMFSAIVITNQFLKIFVRTKLGKIKWLWG